MLGGAGYFFISLQWFWVILLYSSLITGLAKTMSPEPTSHVVESTPVVNLSSSIPMIIITVVITFIMAALTMYILIKIPSTLMKASKKVVHSAAENATPLVLQAQNKKDTKRNYLKLTPLLVVIMKIILVITPVILTFSSQFLEKQTLNFYLAMYVSLWLFGFSTIFFVLQYILASFLSVKKQELW